jgi:hypothetical protein
MSTDRISQVILIAVWSSLMAAPCVAQAGRTSYEGPKTADGQPDLNGFWQALNEANWNLEATAAGPGRVVAVGADDAFPGTLGVVEGGPIPYLPEAAKKRQENFTNRLTLDPEVKCYMPGIPRATYEPYPFQIVQGTNTIMIVYEFAGAVRTIFMNGKSEAPADSWMGWSNGHWDGNTLVVDSKGFNDQTWFDRAGNFHSDALHVVERFTRSSPDHLDYEVTIEDPQTFSRPWKISMPLYRRKEPNMQLVEFKCVEFVEELLYGHLRKQPAKK